ncbi:ABC transporter ATP-binding protein [Saxibacter everestensis]|uniref:Spermidine/putrescine import ATP-binding protein PotA n=1 Tax=Saxibacter everestensis TaxID=2909229 RepID=A0ABY8QXX1_9MICO|nr:ABC transporter ATP-binding protein [Brevibacteriaceae bacterium ZFBP1038]
MTVTMPSHGSAREATATEPGALQIRGVSKHYGDAIAVDQLDLDVRAGEFLSLLGPSGCGKTTLLRMLAGFEEPTSGDVVLAGRSLRGVPAHKRPVNTVFQAYALFPHMTVAENVAYGLRQRRVPRAEINSRVSEALAMVRMDSFATRNPKMLSGGQQQRVALARALVNRPDVLLLDEPMSALDRKLREEMQLELKLLQKQLGITFIFVTHDQEEALAMSDRIVVMYNGRIQQVGTAEDIYSSPASSFVAGFIGKQNFIKVTDAGDGRLSSAEGELLTTAPRPAHQEGTLTAAIRPEAIGVAARPPASSDVTGSTNSIEARLAGVSFLGDVVQYVGLTSTGQEILSRVPRANAPDIAENSQIWFTFDSDCVQVFAQ